MREILFRGKRMNSGEWIEGYYVRRDNKTWIYPDKNQTISKSLAKELRPLHSVKSTQKIMREVFPVDPATVGQYTGLKDKNGKRIFEGDVVVSTSERRLSNKPQVVEWHPLSGYWMCDPKREPEIIGNIHDNPGLLEEGGTT